MDAKPGNVKTSMDKADHLEISPKGWNHSHIVTMDVFLEEEEKERANGQRSVIKPERKKHKGHPRKQWMEDVRCQVREGTINGLGRTGSF